MGNNKSHDFEEESPLFFPTKEQGEKYLTELRRERSSILRDIKNEKDITLCCITYNPIRGNKALKEARKRIIWLDDEIDETIKSLATTDFQEDLGIKNRIELCENQKNKIKNEIEKFKGYDVSDIEEDIISHLNSIYDDYNRTIRDLSKEYKGNINTATPCKIVNY